ncbi:MAG: hypothetical protein KDI65_00190 [Alphaproteobacteria bacterium]|nr:hypothetical protein [Alphaproteobacteria bacterium]
MKKRKLVILLGLGIGAVCLFMQAGAQAVNYTALPDEALNPKSSKKADKSDHSEPEERVCNVEDKKNIRKYEKRFEKFVEKQDDLLANPGTGGMDENSAKRSDLERLVESFTKYLNSDEHQQVIKSYKICGMEMPVLPEQQPFWLP